MRSLIRSILAFALPMAVVVAAAGGLPASGAESAPSGDQSVVVELDQNRLDAGPGEKLSFESTIRNTGDAPMSGYVAHLNILTTDASVYVDPEDWSPKRTQYLDELAPGDSTTLTWNVQAITSGPLILFVSVTSPDSAKVTSSGPLNLTVGGRRVVNAGGVLPLVMWMPAGVLLLLGATFARRRRHR